jgi:hypothetical protein
MPTDAAQLNELLGRFAIDPDMTGHGPNRPITSKSNWHLDHRPNAQQRLSRMAQAAALDHYRSAALRGVLHLDELPPVGVIRAAC